eukprot:6138121-Prorocentrum_lima.AAC.1
MTARSQGAMHMMGLEPRANSGTPRSQQDTNLDVEPGSGTGSVHMTQDVREQGPVDASFLEFQRSWTKWVEM